MPARYTHEWLEKAEEDYRSAIALCRQRKNPVPNSICFHCHQCAEKYLKAVLSHLKQPVPKTHDLITLLELIAPADGRYELIRDVLRTLNPYAVEVRYPGENATPAEAKRAIARMTTARSFIKEQLKLR